MADDTSMFYDDNEVTMKLNLISAVQQKELLWNPNNKLYTMTKIKDRVWKKLAIDLGYKDEKDIKDAWKCLRDVYRCSVKRRRIKSMKPYKFEKQMEFLLPIFRDYSKKQITDADLETLDETLLAEEYEIEEPETMNANEFSDHLEVKIEPTDFVEDLNNDTESLKNFFDSMYESTKLLPKYYQLKIKKDVFNIVLNAEEMVLHGQKEL